MNLASLKGWMKGTDVVVVGCGPSGEAVRSAGCHPLHNPYDERWTIACNLAVKFAAPDFALCVEPYRDRKMWKIIHDASPLIVFTHQNCSADGKPAHPRGVKIDSKDVAEWLLDTDQRWEQLQREAPAGIQYVDLRLSQSPFFAAAVAIHLGFKTIGIIGVDYSDPNRWDNVDRENKQWARLDTIAKSMGSRLINLSPDSRLTSIEQGQWSEVRTK